MTITDYTTGVDSIQLNFDDVISSTLKSADVIIYTENGSIAIKEVKENTITFIDDVGNVTNRKFYADFSYEIPPTGLTYDSKKTRLTVSKNFKGNSIENYLSTVTKINATATKQVLNIVGNDADISVKCGSGSDTISGNASKDKIFGGNGNDIIFGGADDYVLNGETGNNSIRGFP